MRNSDILILGILLGSFLFFYIARKVKRIKIKRMLAIAKRGEKNAISFLTKAGYDIVDIQKKQKFTVKINGRPYSSYVQADFLVKKGGKLYVVEVKTGKQTRATTAGVRRQLLEYYLVFNPHGILLLDMENGTLKQIEFQWQKKEYSLSPLFLAMGFGLILGLIIWRLIN